MTFEPPLLPALDGSSFESQISISDDPPDYDSANRVLKVREGGRREGWEGRRGERRREGGREGEL